MARRATRTGRYHRCLRFKGKKGFEEFLKQRCSITGRLTDVVKRRDLCLAYRKFCAARRHPVACMVNVGRHLGGLKVWASTRVGGANGRNQEYAYVGLCLRDSPDEAPDEVPKAAIIKEEQSSPPGRHATPSPLPSLSNGNDQSTDTPSTSSSSTWVSLSQHSENILELFDSFLQEHVECTGSPDDGVPVAELNAAYRRLCRKRGATPLSSARLSSHLAQRGGVVVSRLPFETVKRAYLGLRWTSSALKTLTPSKRVRQTPCNSFGVLREGKEEGGDWTPLVKDDGLGDQPSLRYWGDDDSNSLLEDTFQIAPPPPPPTPASPSTPSDTHTSDLLLGISDLVQLLDAFVDTESCML